MSATGAITENTTLESQSTIHALFNFTIEHYARAMDTALARLRDSFDEQTELSNAKKAIAMKAGLATLFTGNDEQIGWSESLEKCSEYSSTPTNTPTSTPTDTPPNSRPGTPNESANESIESTMENLGTIEAKLRQALHQTEKLSNEVPNFG